MGGRRALVPRVARHGRPGPGARRGGAGARRPARRHGALPAGDELLLRRRAVPLPQGRRGARRLPRDGRLLPAVRRARRPVPGRVRGRPVRGHRAARHLRLRRALAR
ncbi:hypothetical protein ACFSTC_20350 [Nonomuraea ferruginea]